MSKRGRPNNFTLVENVLGIDNDRLWYWIEGFNGYEVSDDGFVRSMKHYRKYPYGLLIQPKKDRNGNVIHPEDPTFELSNNNNERVAIKLSQLLYIARTTKYHMTGYPRRTCITDIAPRNQSCFIKRRVKTLPCFDDRQFFPKFNIINQEKEEETNPFLEKRYPEVICPIESIYDDKLYYGRKDKGAYGTFHFNFKIQE